MSDYKKIKIESSNGNKEGRKARITNFVYGLVLLVMSCFLFFIAYYNINILNGLTYDETMHKTYTYNAIKKISGYKGHHYRLYVEEEDNPLLITWVIMDSELLENLENLKSGTEIYCCVINLGSGLAYKDCSYEIVEIKTSKNLLTLKEYNEKCSNNSFQSVIACSIIGMVTLVLAILGFSNKLFYR